MALLLDKETKLGVTAEYWVVLEASFCPQDNSVFLNVGLYLDEITRRDPEKLPINIVKFNFKDIRLSHSNFETKRPFEVCYELLKELPQFEGCEDA